MEMSLMSCDCYPFPPLPGIIWTLFNFYGEREEFYSLSFFSLYVKILVNIGNMEELDIVKKMLAI